MGAGGERGGLSVEYLKGLAEGTTDWSTNGATPNTHVRVIILSTGEMVHGGTLEGTRPRIVMK